MVTCRNGCGEVEFRNITIPATGSTQTVSMPKGHSLSLPVRGAIITLHVCSNLNFVQVAQLLHLHPETMRLNYLRIQVWEYLKQ